MLVVLLGLAGLASVGCTARVYNRGYARQTVYYSEPTVFTDAPELVYVEPGVYVVRNYNDAVYYSDGYYWCNRGGVWYRTAYWGDPWTTVHVSYVPHVFVYRDHRAYVHYHGAPGAHVYRAPARTYHTATASAHHHHHHHGGPTPPPPQAHGSASAHGAGSVHVGGHVAHQRPAPTPAPAPQASGRGAAPAHDRAAHHRGHADSPRSSPQAAPRSAPAPQPASRADAPSARGDSGRAKAPASQPSRSKRSGGSRSSGRSAR